MKKVFLLTLLVLFGTFEVKAAFKKNEKRNCNNISANGNLGSGKSRYVVSWKLFSIGRGDRNFSSQVYAIFIIFTNTFPGIDIFILYYNYYFYILKQQYQCQTLMTLSLIHI